MIHAYRESVLSQLYPGFQHARAVGVDTDVPQAVPAPLVKRAAREPERVKRMIAVLNAWKESVDKSLGGGD